MAPLFFAAVSVAAVVLAVAGVVTFLLGLRRLGTTAASRGWPTAPGTVTHAQLTERRDGDVTLYGARVTYAFQVGGRPFTGDRVRPDHVETSSRDAAQRVLDRYPVGAQVPVFHAPEDPSVCLLEPGISVASLIAPVVGVALSGLGAAMWALVRHLAGV